MSPLHFIKYPEEDISVAEMFERFCLPVDHSATFRYADKQASQEKKRLSQF
jgi:hypothetical protein